MAWSPHRRSAVQNAAVLQPRPQKRCGLPPRWGSNSRVHQRQAVGLLIPSFGMRRRAWSHRSHSPLKQNAGLALTSGPLPYAAGTHREPSWPNRLPGDPGLLQAAEGRRLRSPIIVTSASLTS